MKVSIITVVYNNEKYISECIESVLSQSYKDIEYIVIDGNSTDGTFNIIMNYKNKINTIIREKDNGIYDALNKGIDAATGEIIGILHSDDIYYSFDTIENIVSEFKKENIDLLYANGVYVDAQDTNYIKRVYNSKPFSINYLNFGWIPLHTTIFIRLDVIRQFGNYSLDYEIASDYEISLRWFKDENIKKKYLNMTLVKMRLGGKSTSLGLQYKKSKEDLEIIKRAKLKGIFTLLCKIARKVPQYAIPLINNLDLVNRNKTL